MSERWKRGFRAAAPLLDSTEWLRDVALLSGPSGAAYLGYPAWANNAIAYGCQLGFLMLPSVVPILLWLLLNKRFVAALWLEAALAGAPQRS
jgi:hypothetical protein